MNNEEFELIKEKYKTLTRNKSEIILELGCGLNKKNQNAIGIDKLNLKEIDISWDISKGLPFINNESVDSIYSYHFMEHIEDINFLILEINRILKKGGKFAGTVPHFSNPYYYSDPTHKTFFGLYTLCYFSKSNFFKRKVPNFYNDINFEIKNIKLNFASPFYLRNKLKKCFEKIININKYLQEFYEENLVNIIPAYEIEFELIKK